MSSSDRNHIFSRAAAASGENPLVISCAFCCQRASRSSGVPGPSSSSIALKTASGSSALPTPRALAPSSNQPDFSAVPVSERNPFSPSAGGAS